jgi:hypothetical protein
VRSNHLSYRPTANLVWQTARNLLHVSKVSQARAEPVQGLRSANILWLSIAHRRLPCFARPDLPLKERDVNIRPTPFSVKMFFTIGHNSPLLK